MTGWKFELYIGDMGYFGDQNFSICHQYLKLVTKTFLVPSTAMFTRLTISFWIDFERPRTTKINMNIILLMIQSQKIWCKIKPQVLNRWHRSCFQQNCGSFLTLLRKCTLYNWKLEIDSHNDKKKQRYCWRWIRNPEYRYSGTITVKVTMLTNEKGFSSRWKPVASTRTWKGSSQSILVIRKRPIWLQWFTFG